MNPITLKNSGFKKASLEDLHQNSRYWLGQIDFWKNELQFMQNLLKQHFVYFTAKDTHHTLEALEKEMTTLKRNKLTQLKKMVVQHESELVRLVENPISQDEKRYRTEHEEIDTKVNEFENTLKMVKNELFRLAEEVLREEKYQRFIANRE